MHFFDVYQVREVGLAFSSLQRLRLVASRLFPDSALAAAAALVEATWGDRVVRDTRGLLDDICQGAFTGVERRKAMPCVH
jgi:hypothetical protein